MARSTQTSSDAAGSAAAPARSGPSTPSPGGAGRPAGGDRNGTVPTPRREAAKGDRGGRAHRAFLASQAEALRAERDTYLRQADELQAEADALAREHEPGDVQFDEEGGEGGTSSVDREVDLVLSAQARAAIAEIDRALAKIEAGTYGPCEHCHQPIPRARLEALPHAALCVTCKAGGLSSRR